MGRYQKKHCSVIVSLFDSCFSKKRTGSKKFKLALDSCQTTIALAFLSVLFIGGLVVAPYFATTEDTSAVTNAADNVTLSISPSTGILNVPLNAIQDNGIGTGTVGLNVSTTIGSGYTLTMNAKTTDNALTNKSDSTKKINSITAETAKASLPVNTWGYSMDDSIYKKVPTTSSSDTDKTLAKTSAASTDNYNVSFSAKVDESTKPGVYTNTVVFSATSNIPEHTINYNAGDGTNPPSATKGYTYSLVITTNEPTPPTGGTFLGWSTSEGSSTVSYHPGDTYNFPSGTTTTTLYAVYSKTFTLNYNKNTTDTVTNMPDSQTGSAASSYQFTLGPNFGKPVRLGYTFVGWNTSSSATTASYQPGSKYTATNTTTTMYAIWRRMTMQEMTTSYCDNNMPLNQQVQLQDSRDNKLYWVAKLKDGNCWMTQNLDLGSTSSAMTLTPSNSDVSSNFTLPALSTSSSGTWSETYSSPMAYEAGDSYVVGGIGRVVSASGLASNAEERHYHLGNYYNWNAATAGSDASQMGGATEHVEAPNSICPKGWGLPKDTQDDKSWYNLVYYGAKITLNQAIMAPYYLTGAGGISTTSQSGAGEGGIYWTSIRRSGALLAYYADMLTISKSGDGEIFMPTSAGNIVTTAQYGSSIRCVARTIHTFNITYDKNTTSSVSNMPSNQTVPSSEDGLVTLNSNTPTRSGYYFVGWSTNPNAGINTVSEYQPGQTYTFHPDQTNVTLYAIWSNKTYTVNYNANGGSGGPGRKTYHTTTVNLDFTAPTYSGYTFQGWSTSSSASTATYTSSGTNTYTFSGSTTTLNLYAVWKESCIIAGTRITLADGTTVPVEELVDWQDLKVWDFETGSYTSSPLTPMFRMTSPNEYDVLFLEFSDGGEVGIVLDHGFFDADLNKFVYITSDNVDEYVGHAFVKRDGDSWTTVTLDNYRHENKVTTLYSPVSFEHMNFYNNDMLSFAGGLDGMFNYFEVDPTTMAWDSAKKAADIELYGLLSAEDFEGIIDSTVYDAFNGRYLGIAIGKGMLTWDKIKEYANTYLPQEDWDSETEQ